MLHYESATSNNLQNLSYEYDKFGNLHARKDNKRNLEETFTYDEQNRLTGIIMNGMTASLTYDAFGRMSGKQAIVKKNGTPQVATVFSNPVFDNTKVHALTEAEMPDYLVSPNTQKITYSSFDKVKTIDEGDSHLVYQYGYDQQRIAMTETVGSATRKKQYAGNCEFVSENGVEKSWTFLSGPYGVFAVVEKKDAEENIHYILKDHLGSWTTITDAEGIVEQELSYDAWGNLHDPETWYNHTQADPVEAPMFDRGYTGHEHMTAFGLINMNGRMYDPVMSSFLSVDRYVQNPSNSQNFNRYSYCLNNPLKYVDPSGWQMNKPYMASYPTWDFGNNMSYEPRDLQYNSPYMFNYSLSGGDGVSYGGGGGSFSGTYGYSVANSPYYINNNFYVDRSVLMRAPTVSEAVKAWWNDPSFETRQVLVDAGISELNVGVLEKDGLRHGGATIEVGGKEYILPLPTLEVGGNDFYIGVTAPSINLASGAGSGLSGLQKANVMAQSLALGNGAKTELMDWAVRTNYKSARSWGEFRNLRATQKEFRYVNTLGKTGTGYLKVCKGLGVAGAITSTTISAVQLYNYHEQGGENWRVYAKTGLDIVMTGAAFFGPIGFAISSVYFITDLATDGFWGWGSY